MRPDRKPATCRTSGPEARPDRRQRRPDAHRGTAAREPRARRSERPGELPGDRPARRCRAPTRKCDIGAFEAAVARAAHAPTTGDADEHHRPERRPVGHDQPSTARPDGFHFLYGTSTADLPRPSTARSRLGVVPTCTRPRPRRSRSLNPATPPTTTRRSPTTRSAPRPRRANVEQFTTLPGPPVISNVNVDSVTDTTAEIHFSIDPQGADTTYFVEYGPDPNYGHRHTTVDVGSTPGVQDQTVTLTGLDPSSTVHFDVVASNGVEQDVESGDNSFNTLQQVTGVAGLPVTVTDSGGTDVDCPSRRHHGRLGRRQRATPARRSSASDGRGRDRLPRSATPTPTRPPATT